MRFSLTVARFLSPGLLALTAAAFAQTTPGDPAQNYPNRAIRVVVPYPAGGTSDILMRLIGQKLTEK